MKLKNIKYFSGKLTKADSKKRFLNFARLVAFISVVLGSMALIISLSVLYGFEKELRENAVKFTSHIKVGTFNNEVVRDYQNLIRFLKSIPAIQNAVPVVEREGLVSTKQHVEGVILRAYDVNYDITNIKANIKEGSFQFSSVTSNEIVIGKRLANKLGAAVGDKITVYAIKGKSLAGFQMPDIEKFKLIGIYETGMAKYDDIYLYIPYMKALNFFKMQNETANSIDIILKEIEQADTLSKKLNQTLDFPYYTYSVFDIHSSIFAWIEMQKAPIPLILGLISIVAVFNIVTILLITVVEKTHSIGILRALGMSQKDIIKTFVIQGTAIGLVGTLTGSAIGLILGLIQIKYKFFSLEGDVYFLDSLPIHFEPWHFIVVISASVILSLLATLIPSYIASKVQPVKAIRYK